MESTYPCPEFAAPDPAFAVLPADTLGPAVTEPYARVVTCVTSTTCPDVAVPLLLKRIIDAFSQASLPATLPLYLLVGYALLRFSSTLFNEWRDLLFVRVTLEAVSAYAQKTFSHLHALGPRFHAQRKLGSLLPDIDRGTSGIAFLLGVVVDGLLREAAS